MDLLDLGVVWALSIGAAALIGHRIGALGLGVVLGFLFGPIGTALMAYEGWYEWRRKDN